MTDTPISPLRQRMIEDMTIRKFAASHATDYIRTSRFQRLPWRLAGHSELRGHSRAISCTWYRAAQARRTSTAR